MAEQRRQANTRQSQNARQQQSARQSQSAQQRQSQSAARRRNAGANRRRSNRSGGGWLWRLLLLALIAVLVILAVRAIASRTRREGAGNDNPNGAATETTEWVDAAEVLHLSFPTLYTLEGGSGRSVLNVRQFQDILERLYADNYVLVNFYNLAEVENGVLRRDSVEVPTGKKPLVLSQCDIRYGEGGDGYPRSLQVSPAGDLTNEFIHKDGSSSVGAYDVVPVLESFLQLHPDFSYQGARGVLALSGEGGTFGLAPDDTRFATLVSELRSRGWIFASNGYAGISYASELELVREDASQWQSEIGTVLGATDILLLPRSADIGRWSGYGEDNEKFKLLSGLGFRYYCVDDDENRTWMQVEETYLRQVMHVIDNHAEFEDVMEPS